MRPEPGPPGPVGTWLTPAGAWLRPTAPWAGQAGGPRASDVPPVTRYRQPAALTSPAARPPMVTAGRLTRRPSASSVVIVTNWSRIPGAHDTSGTRRYRAAASGSATSAARPVTVTDQPEQAAASSPSASDATIASSTLRATVEPAAVRSMITPSTTP